MPDVKTSAETAATPLDGTEAWRLVQGGNSRQTPTSRIKRYADGGYATVATDADFTLTVGTDAQSIRHTGALTADRAVTLATAGAYAGAMFRITRTGDSSPAFNLNVGTGPLKALATDTWGDFVYDGAAWYLAAYGAL